MYDNILITTALKMTIIDKMTIGALLYFDCLECLFLTTARSIGKFSVRINNCYCYFTVILLYSRKLIIIEVDREKIDSQ